MTKKRETTSGVPIDAKIQLVRGQKVMISSDLANLYAVKPKVLIQAVRRNASRFPADFMFRLTREEARILRSQFVTLGWGTYAKHPPYAFTEQGVAMLSSVLRSERAVRVNIAIMRAFVRLRGVLASNRELTGRLLDLELRMGTNETSILALLMAVRRREPRRRP